MGTRCIVGNATFESDWDRAHRHMDRQATP